MNYINEKLSASTESLSRNKKNEQLHKMVSRRDKKCQIDFYKQGVMLKVSSPIVQKKGGGVRGQITEWSSASRRRMREFLLTHGCDEQKQYDLGVTLTVPGPVMTIPETKKLWDIFRMNCKRLPIGIVWRLELQRRGSPHWHCRVVIDGMKSDDKKIWRHWGTQQGPDWPEETIKNLWRASLYQLPAVQWHKRWKDRSGKWQHERVFEKRCCLKGAEKNSCNVTEAGGRGSWLRYLQDHATKLKQEQIAVGFGRHWGVIHKNEFQELKGLTVDLPEKAYCRFLRMYRRLCTPSIIAEGVPFGRRQGFRPYRGYRGNSVWFSQPDTVRRLSEWAANDKNYLPVENKKSRHYVSVNVAVSEKSKRAPDLRHTWTTVKTTPVNLEESKARYEEWKKNFKLYDGPREDFHSKPLHSEIQGK